MSFKAQTKVELEVLKEECPSCNAQPRTWCVGVRGEYVGATKTHLHGERFYYAERHQRIMRDINGKYVPASEVRGPQRKHSRSGALRCDLCAPLRCSEAP